MHTLVDGDLVGALVGLDDGDTDGDVEGFDGRFSGGRECAVTLGRSFLTCFSSSPLCLLGNLGCILVCLA